MNRLPFIMLLLILLLNVPGLARAEPKSDAIEKTLSPEETQKVLAFLAKKLSANLNAIKTWQGTCHCVDRYYLEVDKYYLEFLEQDWTNLIGNQPGGYWKKSEGEFQFWLDQKQNQLRVNYELTTEPELANPEIPTESINPNNLFNTQWIMSGKNHYVLTDEQIGAIKGFPQDVSRRVGPGRVLYYRSNSWLGYNFRIFDPRDLFGSETHYFSSGTKFFAEICKYYAEALSREQRNKSKQKAVYEVLFKEKTDKSGHKKYFIRYMYLDISRPFSGLLDVVNITFDSAVGFNPTLVRRYYDNKLRYERTLTYKKRDGIFLPDKVDIKYFKKLNSGLEEQFKHRELTMVETKLNGPIDPSLFEIKSLNLKYGERMLDTNTKQAFVQDREGLVPAKEFVFKKN